MRLPRRSRLRRALLAKSVAQVYDAFNRGDMEVFLLFSHPEVEMHTAKDEAGVPFGADLEDVYYGHQGLVAFSQTWMEAWDYRSEPEELIDCGDKLVVFVRHRARGRGSGLEIDQPHAQVITRGRDGRATRTEIFWDRDKALEAAGLSE